MTLLHYQTNLLALLYFILWVSFVLLLISSVSSVDHLSILWLYKYCNRINTTELYIFSVMSKILYWHGFLRMFVRIIL